MALFLDSNAVWLVTGSSSGLGASIAKHAHAAGHNVVATARNPSSLSYLPDSSKVLKLSLDVTSRDSINAAIAATVLRFGRLDVVINSAGYGVTSELEGFPENEARKQMETMFWGPVWLTKESLRVFREVNEPGRGGTIVQISSMGGYLAFQGNAFYHASKFALEGFTKSVHRELNPKWNINLMILSPGGVQTNFASSIKYLPRHPAYDNDESPLTGLNNLINDPASSATWADSDKCAVVLFDAVLGQNERPLPMRLNLGVDTLPYMRHDVATYLKEMEDWEEETTKVMPDEAGKSALLNVLAANP